MLTLGAVSNNNHIYSYSRQTLSEHSPVKSQSAEQKISPALTYRPAFLGFSPKYLEAKKYLDRYREVNEYLPKRATNLYDFSLNRLDGIQEGIKVFEGLNMKEIAFMMRTITEFGINRGCHNMCSHCYADAKPPIKETADKINKMSWNDFKSMTDGFKELNERLGFYASAPDDLSSKRSYLSPFHDADGINIMLKDNDGGEHDFIDIANALYDSLGVPIVFDTAGWTPWDTNLQKRAEKIVKYFSDAKNGSKLYQFNLSLNPFHALHTKQVLLERTGDVKRAEKFKDLYIDRMANALFTFTPMLHREETGVIQRVASSDEKVFDGFRYEDMEKLKKSIVDRVREYYEIDAECDQKYAKGRLGIDVNMRNVERLMNFEVKRGVTLAERGQDIFGKDNRHAINSGNTAYNDKMHVLSLKSAKDFLKGNYSGILDANGKYYLTTWVSTYPTGIKLNFENADKLTAPIRPYLKEDTPITRAVINTVE